MMKRKLALLVLCLVLCLALTGCYTEKDPWSVDTLPVAPSATAVPQDAQPAQEPAQSYQTPTPAPAQPSEPTAEPGLNG